MNSCFIDSRCCKKIEISFKILRYTSIFRQQALYPGTLAQIRPQDFLFADKFCLSYLGRDEVGSALTISAGITLAAAFFVHHRGFTALGAQVADLHRLGGGFALPASTSSSIL